MKDKMHDEKIWKLVARRLAGETSEKDLVELSALLKENPEISYQLEVILNYWGKPKNKNERADELQIARLMKRRKLLELYEKKQSISNNTNYKINFMFRNY